MKGILSAVVIAGLLAVAPACAQDAKGSAPRTGRTEDLRGAGRPARARRQHARESCRRGQGQQEARCAGGRLELFEPRQPGWRGGGLSRSAGSVPARETSRCCGDGDDQPAAEAERGRGGGGVAGACHRTEAESGGLADRHGRCDARDPSGRFPQRGRRRYTAP